MVVKKIGVLSLGRILGFLYGVMGLLVGVIFSLISLSGIGPMFPQGGTEGIVFRVVFGVGAILFLPLFYGVMGFFFGLLSAVLYNVIALVTGGLEIEME